MGVTLYPLHADQPSTGHRQQKGAEREAADHFAAFLYKLPGGGAGSDTFVFQQDGGVDTIRDFDGAGLAQGGDVLDLRDLFHDVAGGDLSSYLDSREENGNTILSVDRDGAAAGAHFQDLVVLQGVTNLHLDQLQQQGNLLTHG